jgi:hypothetical protein
MKSSSLGGLWWRSNLGHCQIGYAGTSKGEEDHHTTGCVDPSVVGSVASIGQSKGKRLVSPGACHTVTIGELRDDPAKAI